MRLFFYSDFLVSLLFAYLSITTIIIRIKTVMAISPMKLTD